MASGPKNANSNRFSILDMSPTKKKRRKNGGIESASHFPTLPELKAEDPKYIIMESADNSKPLSSYSCFGVHRSLLTISKDVLTISQLRDGKLLLLVKNRTTAQKFISSKKLHGICDINCQYHGNLNFSKGTVYAPFLNNVTEEEIVNELSPQGVVSAYKFKKLINGKETPSGVVLLTFDLYNLPQKVDIAWIKVQCKLYIPSPMRCRNCNLLGHTQKFCKRPSSCSICALPPHGEASCTRIFCVNCSLDHAASSKDCEKFKQAKELIKIKTEKKCSISEALKIQKEQNPKPPTFLASYASVVTSNNKTTVTPSSSNEANKKSNDKPTLNNKKTTNYPTLSNSSPSNLSLNTVPTNNTTHNTLVSTNITSVDSKLTNNNKQDSNNINTCSSHEDNIHINENSPQPDIDINEYSSSNTSTLSSSGLFQPLPSLQRVLSSQSLNLSEDELT